MKQFTLIFLVLLLGCKNERPFEWTENIAQLTNKDLKSWLDKSPFNGKWNENVTDDNSFRIDNREQVFPFMGKFVDENDNFKNYSSSKGDIYRQESIIYKDTNFGESFVQASLVYEPDELFLKSFYSEMGNILLSGQNAINESYTAQLSETMVYMKNNSYKTIIYWVNSNNKTYLFGFYQQQNLIFQFGFPCPFKDKLKGIKKIKEINNSLNLNIKEWEELTAESLELNENPKSFWTNPYRGLYFGKYHIPDLQLKIENTEYQELKSKFSSEQNVDYIFAYDQADKNYMISFKREKTALSQKEYENQHSEKNDNSINTNRDDKVFITKEVVINEHIFMDTETYFKSNSYLKIQMRFPVKDTIAREQALDILTNLKMRRF